VAYITTSASGKNKPMPFYTKPQRAYKDLFGVVGEGAAKKEYDTQSDILDFFVDDAKRLRSEIAGPEREQLDRYLNAFESVKKSRQEVEAMSEQLKKHAPTPPGEIAAGATTAIGDKNFDIAIAALASGLTNVVTLAFDTLAFDTLAFDTLAFDTLGATSYGSLGVGGLHGSVGHGQGGDVPGKRQRICGCHFEKIAKLSRALESIPEGDGSMLDNTVIIYTSNNGETHHSSGTIRPVPIGRYQLADRNWPIAILGDLGGRLARGRYFSPGNAHSDKVGLGRVRLGDVWSTLLAAAGEAYKEFGQPKNGVLHKPIDALIG
jgi:hypothetical protein